GVLFADLLDFGPAAPAGTVIIPDDFDLADTPDFAFGDQVADYGLIGLAAMLRAGLGDQVAGKNGIAGCFGLLEVVGHGLLAIGVLAGFGGHAEMGRVLKIGRRDDDRVHVLGGQQVLGVL